MRFIKKIIKSYNLSDDIVDLMYKDIAKAVMKKWEKQASEWSRSLLMKENLIQSLRKKNNGKS